MILTSAELWAVATNCYVIAPERGGPAVIVDAPPDLEAVVGLLARYDLIPVGLLVTHGQSITPGERELSCTAQG